MNTPAEPASHASLRWWILLSISLTVFGGYYVYDAISPLRAAMEVELGFGPSDYGLLVSFYSWPNILGVTLLGGILMDRRGVRFAGAIFISLCVAGALLMAAGASETFRNSALSHVLGRIFPGISGSLLAMLAGRVLFGFGAEVLIVAQNKVAARWFAGRELALAFGLNLVVCRLGTFAAFNVSSFLIDFKQSWTAAPGPDGLLVMTPHHPGLSLAMWVAAAVMLGSLASFLVYAFIDRENTAGRDNPPFSMKDLTRLLRNRSFMAITVLGVFFYSAIFPFTSFATDILQNKFGLSTRAAGALPSLVILSTIAGTPLTGWFVDRRGRRVTLMAAGSVLLMAAHLLLGLTQWNPVIAMVALGLAFSIVPAAMWPSIPLLVDATRTGTAYGLMGMLQNLGLWGVPMLIGGITEWTNPGVTGEAVARGLAVWDYSAAQLLLASFGLLSLILALLLRKGPDTARLEAGRDGSAP